jgi:hypothetical protein
VGQVDGERRTQESSDSGREAKKARLGMNKRQWLPASVDAVPSSPVCTEYALPRAVRAVTGNGLEEAQTLLAYADAVNGAPAPNPLSLSGASRTGMEFVATRCSEESQDYATDTPTCLPEEGLRSRKEAALCVHCTVEERMNKEAGEASELETHGLPGEGAGNEHESCVREQGLSQEDCSGTSNECASCSSVLDDAVATEKGVFSEHVSTSNNLAPVQSTALGVEHEGLSYADAVIAGIKMVEPENEAVQLAELATSAGTSIEWLIDFNYTAVPSTGKPSFLILFGMSFC